MIKDLFKKNEIILRDNYIHIKYYSNIIDISDNKIEVTLDQKVLLIKGKMLIVCALNEYEIVIKGVIKSIEFINE